MDLREMVKEVVNKWLLETEEYHLQDLDELMEYAWIKPIYSHLNVDIFIDDGFSYKRNNHQLLLFVRNGYNKTINSFIPISVCPQPRIMDEEMDIYVEFDDIFNVQDFIQQNLANLIALANEQITLQYFVQNISAHYTETFIAESFIQQEMATLRKKDSGLPVDIWLDEGATYQGHAPRIKFRVNNDQRTTREFSSMLLTNPPTIENMPSTILRKKEIDKIKKFVIENLDMLISLSNGEIDYTKDFLPNMHKIED